MQDANTGSVLVIITPQGQEPPRRFSAGGGERDARPAEFSRQDFWKHFQAHPAIGNAILPAPEECEARLRDKLGAALLAQIDAYAGESRQAALRGVAIRVTAIDYASLDLTLIIQGLRQVAAVFDGHFDLFAMFLTAYLPRAFWSLYPEFEQRMLDCDVDAPPDVRSAFGQERSKLAAAASDSVKKAKWYWAGANTTLIVPVVLALLAAWIVFDAANDERAALLAGMSHRQEQLAKREDKLTERERSRIDSLERREALLIDQLITHAAAPCCAGGNAAPTVVFECRGAVPGGKPRAARPPAPDCGKDKPQ